MTKTIMGTFVGNPHFRQPYAANLNRAYDQLEQLVDRINVELNFVDVVKELEGEAQTH
ncbi:hypothetical protein [Phaeobacter inhibens]|uniref:hypothetical protein n=1 Tax=Phaeobacter inhibens TaxID=221822 RepID=UPI00248F65AF|nr:hypothetical protein [Phaeobacter inhibens]